MVVAAADIAEQSGLLCGEKCPDGGGSEVTTGVEAHYTKPPTLAWQEVLHQVAQVGALLHELGERHQAGRDRVSPGLLLFPV